MLSMDELIKFVQTGDFTLPSQRLILILELNSLRDVMQESLNVISEYCQSNLDFTEDHNMEDEPDQQLTDDEMNSWAGLCKILGYDNPFPDWYNDMWPNKD